MSNAIKSQNTLLQVSTATAATKAITGITAASPPVVTATAHGYANGDIVTIASVGGMTQVNGRAFVVANQTANTFELKGVDGTSYTAYTSGGTAAKETMTEVSEIISAGPGFDGSAAEIDVTHLRSTAKEYLVGLQDFGNVALTLSLLASDTGQAKLRSLKSAGSTGTFGITLSDGRIAAFKALVKSHTFDSMTADSSVKGSVTLRVTGEPAWFA